MEEAAAAERNKVSRPYDGMAQFSEQHTQLAAQLLATAATLERGYSAPLQVVDLLNISSEITKIEFSNC